MKKIHKHLLIALTFIYCLTALVLPSGGVLAQNQETTVVLTSFFPIYAMVKNITQGIEGIQVYNVAQPEAGCLHDYQLSAEEMKRMAAGSIFAINGGGMEGFLESVIGQFPDLAIIDASVGIEPLFEQEHDHAHHEHGEENHDGHEHLINAHFWLDVQNAIQMVQNLSKGLKEELPQQALLLAENEKAYTDRLTVLDQKLKTGLKNLKNNQIITFHEAFPYFAQAYGLQIVAVIAKEPEEGLTPKELTNLVQLIRSQPGLPLFIEPQYPSLAAQTISSETGAPIYTLDPLVTGSQEEALTYYEMGMEKNMETLLEALNH